MKVLIPPLVNGEMYSEKKHVFNIILGVVVKEPKPVDELEKYQGLVGLEELAKTDRILVQQVSIYFNLAFH